jgi:hypothetical protein
MSGPRRRGEPVDLCMPTGCRRRSIHTVLFARSASQALRIEARRDSSALSESNPGHPSSADDLEELSGAPSTPVRRRRRVPETSGIQGLRTLRARFEACCEVPDSQRRDFFCLFKHRTYVAARSVNSHRMLTTRVSLLSVVRRFEPQTVGRFHITFCCCRTGPPDSVVTAASFF